MPARKLPFLPTGFPALDGLIPRSQIVELAGGPSSGKTTLALRIVAGAQAAALQCAWIDVEGAFDPARAVALGVALERLPVARPDDAEQSLEMARQLVQSGGIDLLVLDSAAALVPRLELETEVGGNSPGLQARVLGSGIRRLASLTPRTETTILVLNQIRGGSGDRVTTSGGPAIKQYASVRLLLEDLGGGRNRLRILKNKASEAIGEIEIVLGETRGERETL